MKTNLKSILVLALFAVSKGAIPQDDSLYYPTEELTVSIFKS